MLPADELPKPVPDARPALAGLARRTDGTVASAEAARELGRRGGEVKARRTRLARSLGLAALNEDAAFAPYRQAAAAFRRVHSRELARTAGGECGAGPSSIVASAAWQLAASRYLFDRGAVECDPVLLAQASKLANDSRQNLLAAYELATREAAARRNASPGDPCLSLAALESDEARS